MILVDAANFLLVVEVSIQEPKDVESPIAVTAMKQRRVAESEIRYSIGVVGEPSAFFCYSWRLFTIFA